MTVNREKRFFCGKMKISDTERDERETSA